VVPVVFMLLSLPSFLLPRPRATNGGRRKQEIQVTTGRFLVPFGRGGSFSLAVIAGSLGEKDVVVFGDWILGAGTGRTATNQRPLLHPSSLTTPPLRPFLPTPNVWFMNCFSCFFYLSFRKTMNRMLEGWCG
jgi:hypothetical protein